MINLDGVGYPILLALGRVFEEVRFTREPNDRDLLLSTLVMGMHCDVMEAQRRWLVEQSEDNGLRNLAKFLEWRSDPGWDRREVMFVESVASNETQSRYLLQGGVDTVVDVLQPYRLSTSDAERILDKIRTTRHQIEVAQEVDPGPPF